MLRIACVADTHGKPPGMPAEPVDIWLHAGDLYDHLRPCDVRGGHGTRASRPPLSPALLAWKQLSAPLFLVRGNHDISDAAGVFRDHDVTGGVHQLAVNLFVVGIGWHGEEYFDLPTERDLREVCAQAQRQINRLVPAGARTVLLTHYPPWIPAVYPRSDPARIEVDYYLAVTEMCEALQPLVLVTGHAHELEGTCVRHGGTLFVHPGPESKVLRWDGAAVF